MLIQNGKPSKKLNEEKLQQQNQNKLILDIIARYVRLD